MEFSNVENILQATLDGTTNYNKAGSRVEKLLIDIKDLIEGGGSSSEYATSLTLTIDSLTYVVTAQLLNKDGEGLGVAQTIDLPLESMVVGGSYDSQTKKVVLTLKNGQTVEFSVADLVSGLQTELSVSNKLNPAYINYDSNHRAVSDTEKTSWNNGAQTAQENRAELVKLVDNGPKNRLTFNNMSMIKAQNTGGTWIDNVYEFRGVTYTIHDNFTITATGTATGGNANLLLSPVGGFSIEEGQWVLSGCPSGGSISTYNISITGTTSDFGESAEFTSCSSVLTRIYILEGTTVENLLFKPMVCSKAEWNISHEYVPYRKYDVINNTRFYISSTPPTGDIPDGSIGIGW